MSIWIVLLLATIQGLTEFLPLSSSGHLLLVEHFFHVEETLFLNILLHFGTLVAVVLVFWKDIEKLVKKPFSKQALFLYLSTFVTACIGLAISQIPGMLDGRLLGFSFIITGILLAVIEPVCKKISQRKMTTTKSFIIGVVQGVAVFPGISRSGATISTARLLGISEEESASYSFLLVIPVIIGGFVLELAKGGGQFQSIGIVPCLIGFVVSFVVGFFALKVLKKILKKQKWWIFAPYLIALGIAVAIWQYI